MKGTAGLEETNPHPMCYHYEFGRYASNGAGINKGKPQNWQRWGPAPLG